MTGRVVHFRKERCDRYVGRPDLLGNPYSHLDYSNAQFRVATREEAIAKFREYAVERMRHDAEFRVELKFPPIASLQTR